MDNLSQKEIKLIAIYGRVSTSNQENEGTIETQLTAVKDFAQKNNYTIVQEYLDNGWSGDSIVRPALDQLRMDIKNKIWEAVLIYDPDRLARRYSYQELIMDELREAGVEVMFVTTSAPKNEEDKILYGVKGLFAQYERAKISERFRLGKLRKVKEGHILTTEGPFGYNYIPKKMGLNREKIHGYYEINEGEARVVRMIFDWIANEALTIRKVVRRLQELEIKPRESKRGVWSTSTLVTMLKNKTYIGEAHWGKYYAVVPENPINKEKYRKTKKSSRRIRPEEEWAASKIPVPKIIEPELFMKAQDQLRKNRALCDRNKKNQYLLAGKIKCICGTSRGGEGPQHGKHLYYRCNNRNYCFPMPRTCFEGGINARIADNLVWDKVSGLMTSPELLLKQLDNWTKDLQTKTRLDVGDLGIMEKEIIKLKNQEDRYNKAYGAGLFSIDKLKEYTLPLREQTTSLESQMAKARQQQNQITATGVPEIEDLEMFSNESSKTLSDLNFESKRAIVIDVIDKIISTQQHLQVYGYMPITANYVGLKTIHRYRRASKCG